MFTKKKNKFKKRRKSFVKKKIFCNFFFYKWNLKTKKVLKEKRIKNGKRKGKLFLKRQVQKEEEEMIQKAMIYPKFWAHSKKKK